MIGVSQVTETSSAEGTSATAGSTVDIKLKVNGVAHELAVEPG